jgi:hypothetical protein
MDDGMGIDGFFEATPCETFTIFPNHLINRSKSAEKFLLGSIQVKVQRFRTKWTDLVLRT